MIYIYYNNGQMLHGVVLAFGDRMLRLAVEGADDAVEYRLVNQVWVSEDCEVVLLKFTELAVPMDGEQADQLESLLRGQLPPVSMQRVM